MSEFNVFESVETSDHEQRIAARRSQDKLAAAIYDVREQYGDFICAATALDEFHDRVALVKPDMMKTVDCHLPPVTGIMRRVVKAMKDDWRQHLADTQSADVPGPGPALGPPGDYSTGNKFGPDLGSEYNSTQKAPQGGPTDIGGVMGYPSSGGLGEVSESIPRGGVPGGSFEPSFQYARRFQACGPYKSFDACVAANQDKDDPEAYCGSMEKRSSTTHYAGESVEVGQIPQCDIHKYEEGQEGVPAAYDGKTKYGPWANMCEEHFKTHGVGLGTGRGQRLIQRKGNRRHAQGADGTGALPGAAGTAGNPMADPNATAGGGGVPLTDAGQGANLANTFTDAASSAANLGRAMTMANRRQADGRHDIEDIYERGYSDVPFVNVDLAGGDIWRNSPGPVDNGEEGFDLTDAAERLGPTTRGHHHRRADKTGPEQDIKETFQPSSDELVPEGNFAGYLDSVDQGAAEKVNRNFEGAWNLGSLLVYKDWCETNGLKVASLNSLDKYAENLSDPQYFMLEAAIRTAASRRVAQPSGKTNYLQKADEALTNVLNQKAEEFQEGISALQQALMVIQQAEQAEAQMNPMAVQPPAGTVNVLPQQPGADQGMAPQDAMGLAQGLMGGGGAPPEDPTQMLMQGKKEGKQSRPFVRSANEYANRGRSSVSENHVSRVGNVIEDFYNWSNRRPGLLRGGESDWEDFINETGYGSRAMEMLRKHFLGSLRQADYDMPHYEMWDEPPLMNPNGPKHKKPRSAPGPIGRIFDTKSILDRLDLDRLRREYGRQRQYELVASRKQADLASLVSGANYTSAAANPFARRVSGWDFDPHLAGYVTRGAKDFECDCGETFDVPNYHSCKCGKVYNAYVIGTGGDTHHAAVEKFICREIPERKGMLVASKGGNLAADTRASGVRSFQYGTGEVSGSSGDPDREGSRADHSNQRANSQAAERKTRLSRRESFGSMEERTDDDTFPGGIDVSGSVAERARSAASQWRSMRQSSREFGSRDAHREHAGHEPTRDTVVSGENSLSTRTSTTGAESGSWTASSRMAFLPGVSSSSQVHQEASRNGFSGRGGSSLQSDHGLRTAKNPKELVDKWIKTVEGWLHPDGGMIKPSDEKEGHWQLWGPTVTMGNGNGGLAKLRQPHSDPKWLRDWYSWASGEGPKPAGVGFFGSKEAGTSKQVAEQNRREREYRQNTHDTATGAFHEWYDQQLPANVRGYRGQDLLDMYHDYMGGEGPFQDDDQRDALYDYLIQRFGSRRRTALDPNAFPYPKLAPGEKPFTHYHDNPAPYVNEAVEAYRKEPNNIPVKKWVKLHRDEFDPMDLEDLLDQEGEGVLTGDLDKYLVAARKQWAKFYKVTDEGGLGEGEEKPTPTMKQPSQDWWARSQDGKWRSRWNH